MKTMKTTIIVMLSILLLSIGLAADQKEDFLKGKELYDQGKYEEALAWTDECIKKYGETRDLLYGKYHLLLKLKKYHEALDAAIKYDIKDERKRPYSCLRIAELCLELGKKKEALDWMEKAVDRGFQAYDRFKEEEIYQSVKQEKRLAALIEKIKEKIGLGNPAKDFTVTLMNGKTFTLSKQKGRVVLVDFWSTGCPPCIKEIPNLEKYYETFHKKGFEMVSISFDSNQEKLEKFLEKNKMPWPLVFSGKGWNDDMRALYGVLEIPSLWLVDKKGILRYFGLRGEQLQKAIAKLLAE